MCIRDRTQAEIAATFGVTVRTFQRWLRTWRTKGHDAPGHSPGRPPTLVGEAEKRLRQEVTDEPDATLRDLEEQLGHIVSYVVIHRHSKLRRTR